MGLTGFNRARREAEAKAETEQPTDRGAMKDASAPPATDTNTSETMDGTTPAGSETMDIADAATEGKDATASAEAEKPARKQRPKAHA